MQNIQPAIQAIQTLQRLPESNRTAYYDNVVAPLVDEVADSVIDRRDRESLIAWLYIQSATMDFAVEGITEVTYQLTQEAPDALKEAVSLLPAEQQSRITWLLREFNGEENLPPEVINEEAKSAFSSNCLADSLRDAPRTVTGVLGEFVGTGTILSTRGFPIIQGTLTLFDQNGDTLGVYPVNNGGGAPNYRMRNGPLPPGIYRVSNYRPNRLDNRPGKDKGMILNGIGFSFDLDPTDGTQVFGRSLFRIHPDGDPLGTNGCLGVREQAARLQECERSIANQLQHVDLFKISVSYE